MIMHNTNMFKGIVLALSEMGARYVKMDGFHVYFEVTKGSEADDEEKLKMLSFTLRDRFQMGLKIKRI